MKQTETAEEHVPTHDKQVNKYVARGRSRRLWALCMFPPLIPVVLISVLFYNLSLVKRCVALFIGAILTFVFGAGLAAVLVQNTTAWNKAGDAQDAVYYAAKTMECADLYAKIDALTPEIRADKAFLTEEHTFVIELISEIDNHVGIWNNEKANEYKEKYADHLEALAEEGTIELSEDGEAYTYTYYYLIGNTQLPSRETASSLQFGGNGHRVSIEKDGYTIKLYNVHGYIPSDTITLDVPVDAQNITRSLRERRNDLEACIAKSNELIAALENYLEEEPAYYTQGDVPDFDTAFSDYIALKKASDAAEAKYDLNLTLIYPFGTGTGVCFSFAVFGNLLFALRGKKLRAKVKAAAKETDILGGKIRKKEYLRALDGASRNKDAAAFYSEIEARHQQFAADLPALPFANKQEANKGMRLITAQSMVLDGKSTAKSLKKQLSKLWKERNHTELAKIKQEYACKFDEYIKTLPQEEYAPEFDGQSRFDGNLLQWFGWRLLTGFLGFIVIEIITLGFSKYLSVCLWQKFYAKHTAIDGKRLSFNGRVLQLWGKKIVFNILFVITLTIYKFFAPFSLKGWEAKHTHVAGEHKQLGGTFDGSTILWLLMRLGCILLNIITLGITVPFTKCACERWHAKHTVYDGRRLVFDGTAAQLFGKWIQWLLLGIVTLGIYFIFSMFAMRKWIVQHTHFEEGYYPGI